MNEIEKLIKATSEGHTAERSAAKFWVFVAVLLNVIIPLLLVGAGLYVFVK
jgi:hypothetical protein